jgi:hypothetical protein
VGVLSVPLLFAIASAQPGTDPPPPDHPAAGSDATGSGSAGSGSGPIIIPIPPGAGSGSSGPIVIQPPTDIMAPQVTAAATPTVVRIGARFTVIIRATYETGVEVNLQEPVDLGGVFEVRRKLSEDRKVSGGRTTREWQIEVVPWELGDLVMPGINVTYTAFGKAGQVQTNRIRLKIVGVLGDVVDDPKLMRGNAPPTSLTSRDWFWLWVGGAAGAVIGIAVGIFLVRRSRSRHVYSLVAGVVARPRKIDMTSERALERLLAIENSGVLDREDERRGGYLEMAEVIRDYVGARYRIHVSELTTRELLQRLEGAAPAEDVQLVEDWLAQCDIVKYGGLRTSSTEARSTLDDARALVVTTSQRQAIAEARRAPPSQEAA